MKATFGSFGVALLVAASVARAQTGGDSALAEQLFRDGKTLMEQGKYDEACPKLAESQRNDPGSGTLVALGLCYEKQGRTASAWSTFNEAIAAARQAGRSDREQAASEHVTALEPKLSRLTITVKFTPPAGFVVTRDGVAMNPAVWGSATPVDPGSHTLEATAPGKVKWSSSVEVRPDADKREVVIPELIDAPTVVPIAQRHVEPAPLAVVEQRGGGVRAVGYIVGAAGLVSIAVGGVYGGLSFALHGQASSACGAMNPCSDGNALQNNNAAGTDADVSTALFVAGAIAAAAGVVMIVVGGPHAVRITPTVGGLTLGGTF